MSPIRLDWRATLRGLRGNLTLAALALGLAVVIWFAITDSANEVVEERFGFALAVQAINVPADLATASRIGSVEITIAGRRDDLDRVTDEQFEATVDLAGLSAGAHDIPLRVRSLDGDISVRAVSPVSLEVVLEPVVERIIPITVVVANPPRLGFEVGDPLLSLPTATISGIGGVVDLVDLIVAEVDLTNATVDVSLPVTLRARTTGGRAVSPLRIEPATVTVTVPIQQEIFRRAVAITPDLTGQPATGFRVAGFRVEPVTIVVVGSLAALEGVTEARTAPVAIVGRRADFSTVVAVLAPDGLALEAATVVTVQVDVAPVTAVARFELSVAVVNLAQGLAAIASPARVFVTVSGPAPIVAALTSADLQVSVSARDLGAGRHEAIPLQVGFPSGITVDAVDPASVVVIIGVAAGAGEESSDGGELSDGGASSDGGEP